VTAPVDLAALSHAEKDALILSRIAGLTAAQERIAAQEARIAALAVRLDELTRPPKTPDHSSKPPSQGQKPDRLVSADRPPRKSRPGVGRALPVNSIGLRTRFGSFQPDSETRGVLIMPLLARVLK